MARAKRYSDVKRLLLRKLKEQDDDKLTELRDYIWDSLIVRRFKRGVSVQDLSGLQPSRNETGQIENAIRRVMRRPE
jgi:hypothetical protein